MDEALADSPTLKIAAARTRKALAFADTARSSLYPRVDADLEITRERFSGKGEVPPPFAGSWSTLHQLQATLNWELDFWGKNRAAYESALGQARATAVDAYAARLALSTNVARAYVQLQRAYLQLDVAEATLSEREQIYALTRDRNAAGIDSRLELKQAESALPATREQIAQLQETIALIRNQLAALLGQGPDRGLAIARPAATAARPVVLPSTLPAELLGRRPDLVARRARVEAAQQDIASAKAEFYPNVNLIAFVGLNQHSEVVAMKAAGEPADLRCGTAAREPCRQERGLRHRGRAVQPDACRRDPRRRRSARVLSQRRRAAPAAGAGAGNRTGSLRPCAPALSRRHRQLPAGAERRDPAARATEPRRRPALAPARAGGRSRARAGRRIRRSGSVAGGRALRPMDENGGIPNKNGATL